MPSVYPAVASPSVISIVPCAVARSPVIGVGHPVGAIVVHLDVVVADTSVDGIVAIEVVRIYAAIDHVSVHADVVIAVVDVDVVLETHASAAAPDPSAIPATTAPAFAAPPSVVKASPATAVTPVKVQVQPGADSKSDAKGDGWPVVRPAIVNDSRIIDGNVDIFRLVGSDRDVVAVLQYSQLLRRLQNSAGGRPAAQA